MSEQTNITAAETTQSQRQPQNEARGFLSKLSGGIDPEQEASSKQAGGETGFFDKLSGAINPEQDSLDKAVDYAGKQLGYDAPRMVDEQISDDIRAKYKAMTGTDFPIADKS